MRRTDEESDADRAARRAVIIDGIPVIIVGSAALTLGSSPDPTDGRQILWVSVSVIFILAVLWALVRSFRRADEYQRRIQLESMAVAFAAVLVALQIAGLLAAIGVGELRQSVQLIIIGGILTWQLVADLRTRFHR
jgi:hypothetical protein